MARWAGLRTIGFMEHDELLEELDLHLRPGCGKVLLRFQVLRGALTVAEASEVARQQGLDRNDGPFAP